MTFVEETIQKSWDIWTQYPDHPFLREIRNNTMTQEMFTKYLIEDTKYLKEYARCFGMGIYKSKTMDEIALFYEMLKFVESNESAARIRMLKDMGYDVQAVEIQEKQEACKNYTQFLANTAELGSIAEILFSTLPCMLSYAYIGQCLLEENKNIISDSVYGEWIQEYCCEEYLTNCRAWMEAGDNLCATMNEEMKIRLQEIFRSASLHELRFWDMSYQMKG